MASWNVLITAPRACQALDLYRTALEPSGCRLTAFPPVERHAEDALIGMMHDTDVIVCGDDRISDRVLDSAPRLKAVVKWGTGVDSIDGEAAHRRGIEVANTPDAFSDPVADTVLGYILLFARRLDEMTADIRAGRWDHRPLVSLRECTLGIVGFGNIGRAVSRRAAGFGMRQLVHDVRPVGESAAEFGVQVVPLDELLALSDFVTLHADMRPQNRYMIDRVRLGLLRPTAVLINTARGALVDEGALAEALAERRVAGAALDVFEVEPLPPTSPLRRLPNVYLAPHNSNSSLLAAQRVHANTIHHVLRVLDACPS